MRGEVIKTRRPAEVPLPSALTAAVTAYLDEHRSVLLRGATCDAFWVSKARRAMGTMVMYMRIMKLTGQAFGVAVNPHSFRHAAPPPSPSRIRRTSGSARRCSGTNL